MSQPAARHVPAPRDVVEDALGDWWITTDPAAPFHPPAVAEHIDTHLARSGYRITPTRNPVPTHTPTRVDVALGIVLVLFATAATIQAALTTDWLWTTLGAIAAAALTRDTAHDIRDRRDFHRALDDLDRELP
ncbi:hypothetical protein [Streptomyces pseudovenezuelae]|uniref:hypothetical protein n=1 Tax=Streptomyces pseudovenezuelae TaxID=67350 RepID=UPI0036E5EF59